MEQSSDDSDDDNDDGDSDDDDSNQMHVSNDQRYFFCESRWEKLESVGKFQVFLFF